MQLQGDLERAFDATGLILVFATVWFGISVQVIMSDLGRLIPDGELARKQFRGRLRRTFLLHLAPLLAVYAATSYLYLPLSVRVLQDSRFSAWDFDFQRTAFLCVQVLLLLFFGILVHLSFRLGRKWKRAAP